MDSRKPITLLGVIVDNKLTSEPHIESLYMRLSRAIYLLRELQCIAIFINEEEVKTVILTTYSLFQMLPHSLKTSVTSRTTGSSTGITDSYNLYKVKQI
jgi:hypothetical protein